MASIYAYMALQTVVTADVCGQHYLAHCWPRYWHSLLGERLDLRRGDAMLIGFLKAIVAIEPNDWSNGCCCPSA